MPSGSRPGERRGGRQPGTPNKRTVELQAKAEAAAQAISAAIPGAFDKDAHAFLMAVYKDPAQPMELRIDAAKAAIRYEKPALAAVDVNSVNEHTVYTISAEPLTDEEWLATYGTPDPETEH